MKSIIEENFYGSGKTLEEASEMTFQNYRNRDFLKEARIGYINSSGSVVKHLHEIWANDGQDPERVRSRMIFPNSKNRAIGRHEMFLKGYKHSH